MHNLLLLVHVTCNKDTVTLFLLGTMFTNIDKITWYGMMTFAN